MGKAPHKDKAFTTDAQEKEFVAVAVVDDVDQANTFKLWLEENDIPVVIREPDESAISDSISVTVPEEYLDEAHVVIESQTVYGDIIDMTLDDDMHTFDEYYDEDY